MKKTALLLSLLCIALLFCGCKTDNESNGSIHGVVTDKATGEPVKNAGVELSPLGSKTVSGSDGTFEFTQLEDGDYTLKVTQYGYEEYTSSTIKVAGGKAMQVDIHIEKISDVRTLPASEITPSTAVLNGKLLNNDERYTEVGFVYGTMPTPTLENGATCVRHTAVQIGDFSEAVSGLVQYTTYYVRAYAKRDNTVKYGKTVSFIADNIPITVISDANLMVQKTDLGTNNWNTANYLCDNSTLGGFTDWRLPTRNELMVLYNNRSLIGDFNPGWYWSSEYAGTGFNETEGYITLYYVANLQNGSIGDINMWSEQRVRAVRTITE